MGSKNTYEAPKYGAPISKIENKNGKHATNINGLSTRKKKLSFGESLRMLHLKFWIFIVGLLVVESITVIFYPEIDTAEAIVMLLISVPILVLLLKRHKYVKQFFYSPEYEYDKEEKIRKKAERYQKKCEEQQRKGRAYKASTHNASVYEQQDNGSGCCLIALFLLIFYAPIRLLSVLTKKYH